MTAAELSPLCVRPDCPLERPAPTVHPSTPPPSARRDPGLLAVPRASLSTHRHWVGTHVHLHGCRCRADGPHRPLRLFVGDSPSSAQGNAQPFAGEAGGTRMEPRAPACGVCVQPPPSSLSGCQVPAAKATGGGGTSATEPSPRPRPLSFPLRSSRVPGRAPGSSISVADAVQHLQEPAALGAGGAGLSSCGWTRAAPRGSSGRPELGAGWDPPLSAPIPASPFPGGLSGGSSSRTHLERSTGPLWTTPTSLSRCPAR